MTTPRRVASVLLIALLGGCRTGAPLPAGGYELLDVNDTQRDLPVALRCPAAREPMTFTLRRDDTETIEVHRVEAADRFDAEHVVHRGDRRSEYVVTTDDGCALVAVIDHEERAISRFDPPLTIAWNDHPNGVTHVAEARMVVADARNPRRRLQQGTVTQSVTYVGDRAIRTARGLDTARELSVTFAADLNLADVEQQSTIFVTDDAGTMVEEQRRTVSVFGLPTETTWTLVRVPD